MVVIIGYGDDISDEDCSVFSDITKKHRNNAQVLIYKSKDQDITSEYKKLTMKKAVGQL
jgi:hypothetical protein